MTTRTIGLAAFAAGAILTLTGAAAPDSSGATVREDHGDIHLVRGGADTVLVHSGRDRQPVLSPDGSKVAFIRLKDPAEEIEDGGKGSLWIADVATGRARQLVKPRASEAPGRDFRALNHPVFTSDGRSIYVLAHAWVTSDSVHRVDLKTGVEHYVTDGNSLKIVRTGPYSGLLLIARHKYNSGGQGGSYEGVDLMRPNGKVVLVLPGEPGDNNDGPWLKQNGWQAW